MVRPYLLVLFLVLNLSLGVSAESRALVQNAKSACASLIGKLDERFLPQPRDVPELMNLLKGNRFRDMDGDGPQNEVVVGSAELKLIDEILPDKILTELGRYRLAHALLEDNSSAHIELSLGAQAELKEDPYLRTAIRALLSELKVNGHWALLPQGTVRKVIDDLRTNGESRASRMISIMRTPVSFIPPFWIFSALSGVTGLKPLQSGRVLQQNIEFYKQVLMISDRLFTFLGSVHSQELVEIRDALAMASVKEHPDSLLPLALALDQAPKPSPLRDWYYGRSASSTKSTFDAVAARSESLALLLGALAQLDVDQALVGEDFPSLQKALRKDAGL